MFEESKNMRLVRLVKRVRHIRPEGGQDNQDMMQAPGQDNPRTVSGRP